MKVTWSPALTVKTIKITSKNYKIKSDNTSEYFLFLFLALTAIENLSRKYVIKNIRPKKGKIFNLKEIWWLQEKNWWTKK